MGKIFTIKYVDSHYTSDQRVSRLRNSEVDIDIGSILDIDRSLVSYHLGSFPLRVLLSNSHSRIPGDITKDDWLKEQRLIWNLNTQRALFTPGHSFNDIHVNDNAKIETTNSNNLIRKCLKIIANLH